MSYTRLAQAALVLVRAFVALGTLAAQQPSETTFQNNQIGMNTFVSDQGGSIYMIFRGPLYRNMNDESDAWDQVATNINAVAADPKLTARTCFTPLTLRICW